MLQHFKWPKPEDKSDEKLIKDVIDHRCHIVAIPAGTQGPEYSFSIGLFAQFEHPELVIFGIDRSIAGTAINDVCGLIEQGRRFNHGDSSDEIFAGVHVVFLSVDPSFYPYYLGTALWFYKYLPNPFPVLQMVWADKQQKFPWESGYDIRCQSLQPLLQNQGP